MLVQKRSNSMVAVVGPTATGKSAVALRLAQVAASSGRWQGVSLISVDSRQVYKGLEICSGVDLPPQWNQVVHHHHNAYQHPQLPIFLFGTSVATPDQEWSVAHFRSLAWEIMASAWEKSELVICVGGTGLYHEHLLSTESMIRVGPSDQLRQQISTMSLEDVQLLVQQEAGMFWEQMNYADRQNLRRLVRSLEKARAANLVEPSSLTPTPLPFSVDTHYTLGLTDQIDFIAERIKTRVLERLQHGAIAEVQTLLGKYDQHQWRLPAFSSTGCKEVRMYIEGVVEYEELVKLWTRREVQYAKRQLTWWRKHQYATSLTAFTQKLAEWYVLSEQEVDDWQTSAVQSCILSL